MPRVPLRKTLTLSAVVLLLGAAGWLAVYAWNSGFTGKWRRLIATELARHGLRAEIGRLTLDPIEGLTARGVRLFDMTHRDMHLADISSISLDIDMVRLINDEEFLRTVTLNRATVALPVDPSDPDSEWLNVSDLNARLVFQDRRIEIARADGVVSGVRVNVRGTVRKGPPVPTGKRHGSKRRTPPEEDREFREMRDRRAALQTALRLLERFRIPAGSDPERTDKARIDLEVSGDLADLDRLEVRASLDAGALVCGDYELGALRAQASLSGGALSLDSLLLRDRHGEAHASANWRIRTSEEVHFSLDSTADLPSLLGGMLDEPWLKEVVFYSAPSVSMEGTWDAGRAFSWTDPPVDVSGRLETRRFLSRGTVFEALETDFSIRSGEFFYLRNSVLLHRSGSARGQVLVRPDSVRYGLESTLRPEAFLQFLPGSAWRKVAPHIEMDDRSRMLVRLDGGGTGGPDNWKHRGRVELTDVHCNGMYVQELGADIRARGNAVSLRNAELRCPDGTIAAGEADIDASAGLAVFREGMSSVRLPEASALFPADFGGIVRACRFDYPPRIAFEGTVDFGGRGRHDLSMNLEAGGESGILDGERYRGARDVTGTMHAAAGSLVVRLAGNPIRGTLAGGVLRLPDSAAISLDGRFPLGLSAGSESGRQPPDFRIRVTAAEPASVLVAGFSVPVSGFEGSATGGDGPIRVTAAGEVYGGRAEAALEFPDPAGGQHTGDILVENVGFAALSRALGESGDTAGTVAGRFRYRFDGTPGVLTGTGTVRIGDGNVFALPVLNRLSNAVTAILPGGRKGRSVAPEATAEFRSRDGVVEFTAFEAVTSAFVLTASGRVDIPADSVELRSAIQIRAVPGITLPGTAMRFEYDASGSLAEPGWHLRVPPAPPPRNPR